MSNKKHVIFVGITRQTLALINQIKSSWDNQIDISLVHNHGFWLDEQMAVQVISGTFGLDDIRIDLRSFLQERNCHFIQDQVVSLLPNQQRVITEAGRLLNYDVIVFDHAIDLGIAGKDIPVFGHFFIKPSYHILEIKNELETLIELNSDEKLDILVLGGGREGLAYALQLEVLLQKRNLKNGWALTIIEAQDRLLPHLPKSASAIAQRFCRMSNIEVLTETEVQHIQSNRVVLTKGQTRRYDLAIRTYPEIERTTFEKSDLATDHQGRILTNETFQAQSHREIFAFGDCGRINKKYFHQSRLNIKQQVKLMAKNIVAYLKAAKLKNYKSNKPGIFMISLGQKYGMIIKGQRVVYGQWCLKVMNWLNRRHINQLRRK